MNILVLGHNGMLGHMVCKYLSTNHVVQTINHRFPSEDFKSSVSNFDGDYIINAVGSIPQKTKNFTVNYALPIWLIENTNCRIIHPDTDSGSESDDYTISKKTANAYIKQYSKNTKIIKASIIGPEINTKHSLFDWFLKNENNNVDGYTQVMWNGITTLEWAEKSESMINNWDTYEKETIFFSECISKYDLLNKIKSVFNKDIKINLSNNVKVNRCLSGDVRTDNIEIQLNKLKNYYYENTKA